MALTNLFNIPATPQEFDVFGLHNWDMHLRIIEAIRRTRNIVLPSYPIYPINLQDLTGFGEIHQRMHFDYNQVLGTIAADFSEIPTTQSEMSSWFFLHAQDHRIAANILRLG